MLSERKTNHDDTGLGSSARESLGGPHLGGAPVHAQYFSLMILWVATVVVLAGLGVTTIMGQDLTTELAFFLRDLRAMQSRSTTTVDGATTFATTATYQGYLVLACTGAETINTITGAVTGTRLYIENTDTDCTIADDDDATAANAIDLTGVATNDVGAAKKIIGLIYNGTDWLQFFESDN